MAEQEALHLNLWSCDEDESAKDLINLLLEFQGEKGYKTQATPCDRTALEVRGQLILYGATKAREFLQTEVDKVYKKIRTEFPNEYIEEHYNLRSPYPFNCPCCEKEPNYKQITHIASKFLADLKEKSTKTAWEDSRKGLFQDFLLENGIARSGIDLNKTGITFSIDYIGEEKGPSTRKRLKDYTRRESIQESKIKKIKYQRIFSKEPLPFQEIFPKIDNIIDYVGKIKQIYETRDK